MVPNLVALVPSTTIKVVGVLLGFFIIDLVLSEPSTVLGGLHNLVTSRSVTVFPLMSLQSWASKDAHLPASDAVRHLRCATY